MVTVNEVTSTEDSSLKPYIITYDLNQSNYETNERIDDYDLLKECIAKIDGNWCKLSGSSYLVRTSITDANAIITKLASCFTFRKGDIITVAEVADNWQHKKY